MATATMTSKGQITVPKEIRERLGLRTGDRVAFRERTDGSIVVEAEKTVDFRSLRGILPAPARKVTLEEMDQAIRDAAAERHRRGR
jgi:AbrB family looped-hinge helix DNA binding protein